VDDCALVGFGSSWPPNLTLELDGTIECKATTPCPMMFHHLFHPHEVASTTTQLPRQQQKHVLLTICHVTWQNTPNNIENCQM
jgi:hypothetical protein